MLKKTTALAAICVATAANKLSDWDVEIIDENNCSSKFCPKDELGRPDHVKIQEERSADAVGFCGSLSCSIPRLFELAELYKNFGVKTVAGGKHVENLPEETLRNNIDVVVFGDGEEAIRDILSAWQQDGRILDDIPGIAFLNQEQIVKTRERALIADLETLPFPDFGLLLYAKIKIYPVSWQRGCPYNCEFCAVKDSVRHCSAERLTANIIHLAVTRKARKFFIVDDHFGGNIHQKIERQKIFRLCELLENYQRTNNTNFRISIQIRIDAAKYPELLKAMRNAGIEMACIGYESPIDEELRAMRKGYSTQDMVGWTNIFRQLGFCVHGMFIFGYPEKDSDSGRPIISIEEKTRRFKNFIREAKIDTAQILLTVPLPGTELRDRLLEENRIFENIGWEYYDGQYPLFIPDDNIKPEELQEAVKKIMSGFYRLRHFWSVMTSLLLGFPLILGFASFSLLLLRVKYLTSAFKFWRKNFWRNQKMRFLGTFIIWKFTKNLETDGFLEKLAKAKKSATRD